MGTAKTGISKTLNCAIDKHQKIRPLTIDEQMRLIEALKGHKHAALYNMALDTGMRQGELFALTWADIDFSDLTIRINKNHSCVKDIVTKKQVNYTTNTKTAKSRRVIPLANRTKKILIEHMKEQKIQLLRIGIIQTDDIDFFSLNPGCGSHFLC